MLSGICFYVSVLVVILSIFVGIEDTYRNYEWRSMCSNLTLGEEYVKEGEDLEIAQVVATLEPYMDSRLNGTLDDPNPEALGKRIQHPVHWQCLHGTVTVDADIKDHLKVGIFKKPGMSFPTHIRTSHNNFDPDSDPKISSISIKLHVGKLGPRLDISEYPAQLQDLNKDTQDFIFMSADSIPIASKVLDLKSLHEYQIWGGLPGVLLFLAGRPTAFIKFLILIFQGKSITIPFLWKHNTVMPSRYGGNTTAAKFILKPCVEKVMPSAPSGKSRFIKEMSNEYTLNNGVCMDMFVQFQVDPCQTPIETVDITWDESIAPLEKVATLTVPKGTESSEDCEFTTFNPWYGLEEHRPLGFIGRMRKAIYMESAFLRMKKSPTCPFFKGAMK